MIEHNWRDLIESLGVRGRIYGEQLRANCPIHDGRDPNFGMNIRTGQWTCWSQCGSGSFYRLVSLVLNCSVTSARDWVLEHDSAFYEPLPEPPHQTFPELWRIQYQNNLALTELPQWWFDRGWDWEDAVQTGVRWDARAQQLLIPYIWRGELVGTIARNFNKTPKYVNSPHLQKARMLFGPKVEAQSIVVVEGPLDALWLNKHGIRAVALLGLTLSEAQTILLHQASEIVLMMDNDEPGRDAQQIAIDQFQKAGRWNVKEMNYPDARKDAQEYTRVELAAMWQERTIATGGFSRALDG